MVTSRKKFKIDEIDRKIITLIQNDPNITHSDIAQKVDRSQPTIGMRLKKLTNSGVLKIQAGLESRVLSLCCNAQRLDHIHHYNNRPSLN